MLIFSLQVLSSEARMLRTLATILLIGCFIDEHVTPRRVTEPISGIQIIDGICLAQRTDRLVYRHKNSTHVIIAFDILKKGVVDVFIWEIIRRKFSVPTIYQIYHERFASKVLKLKLIFLESKFARKKRKKLRMPRMHRKKVE